MNARGGSARRRRWPLLLAGFGVFAVIMATLSGFMLASWGDMEKLAPTDAQRAFATALESLSQPPYIEIDRTGGVSVNRDQEHATAQELDSLHLLGYDPESQRLVDVAFPYWFVRLKMSRTFNLGNLTSFLMGDWDNLDLTVTEEDLARRGPGLILDHTSTEGRRIVLWND